MLRVCIREEEEEEAILSLVVVCPSGPKKLQEAIARTDNFREEEKKKTRAPT